MNTKTKAQPFNLADFFTVPQASAGKPFPLKKPDGTETEFHLVVLGADAPVAKQALLAATRIIRDERKDEMSDDEKTAINDRATLQFRLALVTGWNLPVAFSQETLAELFSNNPGLAQEVEQFSGDRSRFFASKQAA